MINILLEQAIKTELICSLITRKMSNILKMKAQLLTTIYNYQQNINIINKKL